MNRFSDFLLAVDSGEDEAAEGFAQQLTYQDEAALLALCNDASQDRRWWGIRGLAQIAQTTDPTIHRVAQPSIERVVDALHDAEPSVRAAAALALAHLHHHVVNRSPNEAIPVLPYLTSLAECLSDADGMVRQAATDALAQLGDDAVPILAAILQTTSLYQAQDEKWSFVGHDSGVTSSLSRQSRDLRATSPNHDPEPENLERSREAARTRAAMALRRIATMSAAAILFRYLNDSNYLVHTYAHEGLEELGLLDNLLLAV